MREDREARMKRGTGTDEEGKKWRKKEIIKRGGRVGGDLARGGDEAEAKQLKASQSLERYIKIVTR